MGSWLDDVDVEKPGSRFTPSVALAILTRPGGERRYSEGSDTGDARAVVDEVLDGVSPDELSALGDHSVVDGSYGRGASGWVPVLEFAAQAIITGVIGNAAWDAIKVAARQLTDLLARFRREDVAVLVSRGSAALVAIQHLVADGKTGVLDIEAVEEPPAVAGRAPSELSYVGAEPWLVSLVNESRTVRYVVAISPAGEVIDTMTVPMTQQEAMYGILPPRD
jgi:hypothetical protein